MKVKVRKTAQGTEYWDTEEKKTIFVAAGKKPDFEVTENPKSMLKAQDNDPNVNQDINLDEMNTDQLRAFAEQNNIDVPGNMSKEDTIRNYIKEQLTAADA
ncbi:hypothetical protein [Sediminibacillus sp. JSM 1682029]|uniref:hypothetical protein n=1 Tax=Sediminibacillus sp. JSM 1682029 TaxID=3229857 RepID=UPI0035265830